MPKWYERFMPKRHSVELANNGLPKTSREARRVIAPGSISIESRLPGYAAMADGLSAEIGTINPLVPKEYIDLLLGLSISSPLLSEVVYDSVLLANSGHSMKLTGQSDRIIEKAVEISDELTTRMHSGGTDGWFAVAFYQALITGALSHEWVINQGLTSIDRSKFVPVQTIKFRSSGMNDGRYLPFQQAHGKTLELNPFTYSYRPLLQWENIPYGIPPYFAAIEPIWIQREFTQQVRGITKKFGLLGMTEILLEAPLEKDGETEEKYHARLKQYLEEASKNLDKKLSDGILLGYKGSHEFSHYPVVGGDVKGVAELWDRIDTQANSGANTDPSLHGRNNSRTETHIRQIFQKVIRQLKSMRTNVARSAEYGFELNLLLHDIPGIFVEFEWDSIDSLDDKHDEETFGLRIKNTNELYRMGLISQDERARRLGIDEPDMPDDRRAAQSSDPDDGDDGNESNKRTVRFRWKGGRWVPRLPRIELRAEEPVHDIALVEVIEAPSWPDYDDCCNGNHEELMQLAADETSTELSKILEGYVADMLTRADRNASGAMKVYEAYLKTGARKLSPKVFAEEAYQILAHEYGSAWRTEATRKKVDAWARKFYRESRLGEGFKIATKGMKDVKPIFHATRDTQTMKFLQDTDFSYLGKYIERGDTAERLKRKISNQYIASGRDWSDKKYVEGVRAAMNAETYQAERVIRTNANMSRNFANVRTYQQLKVKKYTIVEVGDKLTCAWCDEMDGRTMEVQQAGRRLDQLIDQGPDELPNSRPFVTAELEPEVVHEMSDEELQRLGFDTPSFHPNCRGTTVADI